MKHGSDKWISDLVEPIRWTMPIMPLRAIPSIDRVYGLAALMNLPGIDRTLGGPAVAPTMKINFPLE
jgi:hypothetical protein